MRPQEDSLTELLKILGIWQTLLQQCIAFCAMVVSSCRICSRNAEQGKARLRFSRKTNRIDNIKDTYHYLLKTSDPLVNFGLIALALYVDCSALNLTIKGQTMSIEFIYITTLLVNDRFETPLI